MGSHITRFSPEQDAIIRRDWPAGIDVNRVILNCRNVEGRHDLEPRNVSQRAIYLHVTRPAGWGGAGERERAAITAALIEHQETPLRTVASDAGRSLSLIRLEYDRLRQEGRVAIRAVGRPMRRLG